MFITLLFVSLILAAAISFAVVYSFRRPLRGILERIVGSDVADHWYRFTSFVFYIVGVAYGVDMNRIERYIQKSHKDEITPSLDTEAWIFELYQVIERTLGGLARAMVTVLILGLIAVVVLRVWGHKSATTAKTSET